MFHELYVSIQYIHYERLVNVQYIHYERLVNVQYICYERFMCVQYMFYECSVGIQYIHHERSYICLFLMVYQESEFYQLLYLCECDVLINSAFNNITRRNNLYTY